MDLLVTISGRSIRAGIPVPFYGHDLVRLEQLAEAGSRFAERLLTVVAMCRQQGRRLLDFLVVAGEAALRGTAAPSLLPAGQDG